MHENTTAQKQESTRLESNESMTTMSPPAFGLSAASTETEDPGGGGGGSKDGSISHHTPADGDNRGSTMTVSSYDNPFQATQLPFPGQVAWVHSPCF